MHVHIDGRTLGYDLLGPDEAPVVCLAHAIAADGGMWAEQVPDLLAAGWRVLRPDARGHGASPPLPGPCTMEDLAADLSLLVDALDIGRFHLVGLSMGGMAAQAFALAHPQRLRSLVVCDAQAASHPQARAIWGPRVEAARAAGSMAPVADASMNGRLSDACRARHPHRWNRIRDSVLGTPVEGYAACAAALQDFDFTAALPGLRVPTLVICGAADPLTPPAANRRIAELIPGARYEEIADACHFSSVDQPKAFNETLLRWLAQQG